MSENILFDFRNSLITDKETIYFRFYKFKIFNKSRNLCFKFCANVCNLLILYHDEKINFMIGTICI